MPGFVFIWITDGKGWFTAESKLREAFDHIPEIYNLSTIDSLIDKLKKD
ncbi:MAG: DpnII family type II restriction endonuclease [Akkermansia sp.]